MNNRIAENQERRLQKLQAMCALIEAALDAVAAMIVAQSPALLAVAGDGASADVRPVVN